MPISLKFGAIQVSKEEKQYYTPDNTPDNSPSLSRASAGIPLFQELLVLFYHLYLQNQVTLAPNLQNQVTITF